MGEPLQDSLVAVCPNCGTLNHPSATICAGCGVDLSAYREAQSRLQEWHSERAQKHQEELDKATATAIDAERDRNRRRFRSLLRYLVVLAIVGTILVVVNSTYQAVSEIRRRARLSAEYERALDCMQTGDFACARDGFVEVLRQESGYRDAEEHLRDARISLAQEYAADNKWDKAIHELNEVLRATGDDDQARELREDYYDRWYRQALSKGQVLTAAKILARRMLD